MNTTEEIMSNALPVFVLDSRERTKTVAAKPKAEPDVRYTSPPRRELRPGKPRAPTNRRSGDSISVFSSGKPQA